LPISLYADRLDPQVEKLGSWYSCNPLWAQLGDLYGALGNPVKVAHTVVAGDSRKSDLINSVLSFLSYFIRSGAVRKRREYRCSSQRDVQQAASLVERARGRRPYLFGNRRPAGACNDRDSRTIQRRESRLPPSRESTRSTTGVAINDVNEQQPRCASQCPEVRPRISRSVSPFKRRDTVKSDLDAFEVTKSSETSAEVTFKLPVDVPAFPSSDDRRIDEYEPKEPNLASSKVEIIVSEIQSRQPRRRPLGSPLRVSDKTLDVEASFARIHDKSERDSLDGNADSPKTHRRDDGPRLSFADDGSSVKRETRRIFFTLGGEDGSSNQAKSAAPRSSDCQCSYTFSARLPSTSAQLPEGVLRKIIQRNFPESSKGIQPPPGTGPSAMDARSIGFCLKCNGQGYAAAPRDYDGGKQVLETPTNATEVLRTCGNSEGGRLDVGLSRSNSLEALMEANGVVELPMPQLVSGQVANERTNERTNELALARE